MLLTWDRSFNRQRHLNQHLRSFRYRSCIVYIAGFHPLYIHFNLHEHIRNKPPSNAIAITKLVVVVALKIRFFLSTFYYYIRHMRTIVFGFRFFCYCIRIANIFLVSILIFSSYNRVYTRCNIFQTFFHNTQRTF